MKKTLDSLRKVTFVYQRPYRMYGNITAEFYIRSID